MKEFESKLEELLSEDTASVLTREQSTLSEILAFGSPIVLFGAGFMGRKALATLRGVGMSPAVFTDDNPAKWNKFVDGIPVLPPQEAASIFGKKAVFVVTILRPEHRFDNIRQRLVSFNCRRVLSSTSLMSALRWKYPEMKFPHFYVDLPHRIIQNADEVRRAFQLWADEESRHEYLSQLRWRMFLDFDGLPPPSVHEQYFPNELFSLSPDEIFIDCGAFDGDTLRAFIQRQGSSFGSIIAFEPDPGNHMKLLEYVTSLPQIIRDKIMVSQLAVGAYGRKVRFKATGNTQSTISNSGTLQVGCARLDQVLGNQLVTYIKLDIEGAELDALVGAHRVIERTLPILAICVYHRWDHLWQIPLFVRSLSERYRFFLRAYCEEGVELVCYAVPPDRCLN